MAEEKRPPEPTSKERPQQKKDPEPNPPPVADPPEKTRQDILDEDRFQSTDN